MGHPDTNLAACCLADSYTKLGKDADAAELARIVQLQIAQRPHHHPAPRDGLGMFPQTIGVVRSAMARPRLNDAARVGLEAACCKRL